MKLINLTPHEVTLMNGEETVTRIPPSGTNARVGMTRAKVGSVPTDGHQFPIYQAQLGQVEGLPEPEADTLLIVSRVVAEACRDRNDLVIPDEAVRDAQGRIVGCRAFARV